MKMFPNGITGFYGPGGHNPPQIDESLFKQIGYSALSRHGGKVIEFQAPQYPANYYTVHAEMSDSPFFILLNEHYPFLAFASAVEYGNIQFMDIPALHEDFSPFYRIMSASELGKPFNLSLTRNSELWSAELDQITYWKPETIGQIIYNHWD